VSQLNERNVNHKEERRKDYTDGNYRKVREIEIDSTGKKEEEELTRKFSNFSLSFPILFLVPYTFPFFTTCFCFLTPTTSQLILHTPALFFT
jgi:hypothetical protein